AAEFLMRVNYGLILGNFELDFGSGQIYYKTTICTNDIHLNSALIERGVYANVWTMDKYLPGIMKVIYADVPAAEALAQIEG
ncbi:MAG TPA: YbjN domain-containing protein, partial [Allocoleopsis sp.]